MSAETRESPRAAIRGWLEGTKGESLKSRSKREDIRHDQYHRDDGATRRSRKHEPKKKGVALERAAAFKAEEVGHRGDKRHTGHEGHAQDTQHEHTKESRFLSDEVRHAAVPNDRGLAEKLGLHAPFRLFKDRSDDGDVDLHLLDRPRKRRRRDSPGSYLEPAEIDEQTMLGPNPRSPDERAAKIGSRHVQADQHSESSALTPTVPGKAAASFERRPRHKTREYRYELKHDKDINKKNKSRSKAKEHVGGEKKDKKPRRKEKSGAALLHDFTAHNVSQDRLTLQPAKALGLFGRGRASSPVLTRGLPDLAFSEMSFLNARRSKPEDSAVPANAVPAGKSKRRKTTKAADTEAEISRYFTSAKDTDRNEPERQHEQPRLASRRRSLTRDTPPDFINLPGTPFLGFGSCGTNSLSPVKRLSSPAMRDLERRVTGSSSRSTSYYTWSESGVPSAVPSQHGKHRILPLETSRNLNRRKRPLTPQNAETSRSIPSPVCAEKTPLQKSRVSITPERVSGSHAADCEGHPSPIVAHDRATTEHEIHDQKRQKVGLAVGCEPQRFVKHDSQRIGLDKRQALPNAIPVSTPAGAKPSISDERTEKAVVNPRLSDLGFGEGANSLDATIEALLNDTRPTGHDFRDAVLRSRISDPHSQGSVDITNAERKRHWPRPSSPGHGSLPHTGSNSTASRFLPQKRSNTEYVRPQSRRSHESELPRPQNLRGPTPGFRQDLVGQPDARDYAMHPPQGPHSRDFDSQSAWNGYGDIYGGHNHTPLIADDNHQYWADHTQSNERGYAMPRDALPPWPQYPVECFDEYEGPDFYERQRISPFTNPAVEEKAYRSNDAWDDTEENLFALDDTPHPDEHHTHAYGNNRQVHDDARESQHQVRPVSRSGYSISSPFTISSHKIGRGFVEYPKQALGIPEETAPSRFWIPQKLY